MSKAEFVDFADLKGLLSLQTAYLLGWAFAFGTSAWVSFFGGFIAYRALPRQQFGLLQHKTFPYYFVISILSSLGLLQIWIRNHPDVLNNFTQLTQKDVLQAYVLLLIAVCQGTNYFVLGPWTSRVMFKRHRLEKEEGKLYTDKEISPAMKSLNRTFMALHSVSSLGNLFSVIALTFHGMWIANFGFEAS